MLKRVARETRSEQEAGKSDQARRSETHKDEYDLASMLDQVTPANCHPEYDTGPSQGKEGW